jgi:hypothetical protein
LPDADGPGFVALNVRLWDGHQAQIGQLLPVTMLK